MCLMLKISTANSLTFLQKLQCRSSWAQIWKVNSNPCSNIFLYLYLNKCIMEINIYLTLVLNRGSLLLNWLRALEQEKKSTGGRRAVKVWSLMNKATYSLSKVEWGREGDESSCFILCAKQNRHLPYTC